MEQISNFLNSLYLGDRYCEKVEITDKKIIFQINCISRVKPGTTTWNYYTDEDIEHGCLVFDEIKECNSKSELIINEDIYEISVLDKCDDIYTFLIQGSNFSDNLISTDIEMTIQAKKFYIYNPKTNSIVSPYSYLGGA